MIINVWYSAYTISVFGMSLPSTAREHEIILLSLPDFFHFSFFSPFKTGREIYVFAFNCARTRNHIAQVARIFFYLFPRFKTGRQIYVFAFNCAGARTRNHIAQLARIFSFSIFSPFKTGREIYVFAFNCARTRNHIAQVASIFFSLNDSLSEEIRHKIIGCRDLSGFPIDLLSDRDSVYTWKPVWKFGDSRENVSDMYGDSRENLLKYFVSHNYFKSDLLSL